MFCRNSTSNVTCGKCISNLLSIDTFKDDSIVKVSRIAANIVWMKQFDDDINTISGLKNASITCNYRVILDTTKEVTNNLDISVAKNIYCKLINNWYNYYPSNKKYNREG